MGLISTTQAAVPPGMQVAVVGAGLAGLTAATALAEAGHEVVVWEKSRGPGGRTATRRGPDGMRFDHGAPFLHDGPSPLTGLRVLAHHELHLPGGGTGVQTVGDGGASEPAKHLAAELDVRTGVRVGAVEAHGDAWHLRDDAGAELGRFGAVVLTAPAPQAADLLRPVAPELAELAGAVVFDPCWTVMVAWERSLELPFDAAEGASGLTWAVAESPKPGRAAGERWVLQADARWSRDHLEDDPGAVGPLLLGRLEELAGRALPGPTHLAAHRWRFARPATPLPDPFLQRGTLLVAGDWCGGDTAGAAVRSGSAAAAALRG